MLLKEVNLLHWSLFFGIPKVANVDDVLHCHFDFLNGCLKDCMLTSPELLKIVIRLMKTFIDFSNFILVRSGHTSIGFYITNVCG